MKVTRDGTGGSRTRPLDLIRPGDGDPRHGSVSAYNNHMCRCELCRGAWREYQRDLRQRRRDALNGAA
jgi:hypothetical protein